MHRLLLVAACALPFSAAAAPLTITTEENPPLNFMDPTSHEVTGIATQVVKEVLEKAGVEYKIVLLPWQRAYQMALDGPTTCVYSTTITDERKPLFKWVAPVTTNNWVLYSAADSDITLKSLEDAKPYKIGGYQGSAMGQFMIAQGYNIEIAPQDVLNVNKLVAHHIDLWVTGERGGPVLAERQGVVGL